MNEESATGSSGKMMIGVKVDRFWNRHWRLLLFIGVIVLSSITGGNHWMSFCPDFALNQKSSRASVD